MEINSGWWSSEEAKGHQGLLMSLSYRRENTDNFKATHRGVKTRKRRQNEIRNFISRRKSYR